MSVEILISNYDCLESITKIVSGRKRPIIFCKICREFDDVAKQHSRNHTVPFRNGVVVDSQEKLKRVVDHLESLQHQQAVQAKKQHELWQSRSDRHEWRKYLNSENEYLLQELTKMTIDVYNDALHGTLPCFNWASRSLEVNSS